MADGQEKKSLDVTDHEFSKSDDKVNIATSGVTDGVDFAESLPGGGDSDNKMRSSITAGDDNEGFDHRNPDDPKT
jgi:hypothetical protein